MQPSKTIHIAVLFFFLLVLLPITAIGSGKDISEDLAVMPAALNSPTGAINGDNIYVVSGYDPAIGWSDVVYRYSISEDSWSTVTGLKADTIDPIPTDRTDACNTGMIEGYDQFCVIGGAGGTGFSYDGPVNAVECYSPATNDWTTLDPLPEATSAPYCAVKDGVIYVTGGYTGSMNTALWWLDTQNLPAGWQTATAARPIDSFGGSAAITKDPELDPDSEWRFTQFMGSEVGSTSFGLDSGQWTSLADNAELVYTCAIEDGPFNTLILGGGDYLPPGPYETTDSILYYDSLTDSWKTATAKLPFTRAASACVQDEDGNVYQFGGYSTDLKGVDLSTKLNIRRLRFWPESDGKPGEHLYLTSITPNLPWMEMSIFMLTANDPNPMPVDLDVPDEDNGTARVKIPADAPDGLARIQIQYDMTGRSDTKLFRIEGSLGVNYIFTDDFMTKYNYEENLPMDVLGLSLKPPASIGSWQTDAEPDEFTFQFGIRVQFKKSDEKDEDWALKIEDSADADAGALLAPLFPFESGPATVSWDYAIESGDGLSLALYDSVGATMSTAFVVEMLNGKVSVVNNQQTKETTDCNFTLSASQWYTFSMEMDLDKGTASLLVDDAATDCTDFSIPFGSSIPVQGLGFVLNDQGQGTSWVDNVEVTAIPEPVTDDDDDDTDTDDDDDDTGSDDDDDNNDDDDDEGCCGC